MPNDDGNETSTDKTPPGEVTFGELPRRMKLWFFGIMAAVAAIAVLASNSQAINTAFTSPSPDMLLEDAAIFDDGYAPRVDLIVLNKGGARGIVTGARIKVLDELRVPELRAPATEADAVVNYDVTVTVGDDEKKTTSVFDFGRQVAPLDADRIALNIGTNDTGPPTLVACKIQVVLSCAGGKELETLPLILPAPQAATALLSADTSPEVASQFPTLYEWLNDPSAVKGLAVRNLVSHLERHLEAE